MQWLFFTVACIIIMFVHLRGRGTYSMLEGIGPNATIVQRAKELWQPAIALTDFNGMYGVVDFYSKAKGLEIQPIIGVELPYVAHRSLLGQDKSVIHTTGTLTYLALSEIGYHNLLHIVSEAYQNSYFDIPCVDNEILAQYSQDVVVLVGGIMSYAYQAVSISQENKIMKLIEDLTAIFPPERIVIDITAQLYDYYPVLKKLHEILLKCAHENMFLVVTSSGFTYPYADQKTAYETALAIKDNKRNYDPDARKVKWDYHILSEDEVRTILEKNDHTIEQIELWTTNTLKVAQMSHVTITLGQSLFPNYEVPEDIQKLYEEYKDELIQE